MIAEALGWAAIEDRKIKVRTISDTRRSAIINFLVTERLVMLTSLASDDHIERLWSDLKGAADVVLVEVRESNVWGR